MNLVDKKLARKYAIAFLNVFEDRLSYQDYECVQNLYSFLENNSALLSYFKLPNVEDAKQDVIDQICSTFNLISVYQNLFALLKKKNRLYLIKDIFYYIQHIYRKRNGIMHFIIFSSQALSPEDIDNIRSFLADKTKLHITYNAVVDSSLIAGIRLQSDSLLWEDSIAKRLRQIRSSLNIGTHYEY